MQHPPATAAERQAKHRAGLAAALREIKAELRELRADLAPLVAAERQGETQHERSLQQ